MALSNGFLIPSGSENSQEFSEAIHALVGDGVCKPGGQYSLTLSGGFKVTLATGYAVANGRYVKHDEPFSLNFHASGNTSDRYDAVAARVDYQNRNAEITILVDVDPDKPIRNNAEYDLVLYVLKVRRGATVFQPGDLQDVRWNAELCGYIVPLSDVSNKAEYVYKFINSGIDEVVARLLEKIDAMIKQADKNIAALDEKIRLVSGGDGIGDLKTSRHQPLGWWILCDGTEIPAAYPQLVELFPSKKLPSLSSIGGRYKTYIYGGAPVEV